jgi:hypothetical protein
MATIDDDSDDFKMDDLDDSDELNKSIKALAEAILKYNTMVNMTFTLRNSSVVSPEKFPIATISRTSANIMDDGTPDGTPRSGNTSDLASTIRNEINYYSDIDSEYENESDGYESDESKSDYTNDIQNYRFISSRRGAFMIPKQSTVKPGVSFIDKQNNNVSRFPDINSAIISSILVNTSDEPGSQTLIVLEEGLNKIKINQDNTGNIVSVAIVDSTGTSSPAESVDQALANITPVEYHTIERVVDAVARTQELGTSVVRGTSTTRYNSVGVRGLSGDDISSQDKDIDEQSFDELNGNPTVPSTATPHGEMLDASIDILSTLARTPEIGTSVGVRGLSGDDISSQDKDSAPVNTNTEQVEDNDAGIVNEVEQFPSNMPYEPLLDISIDILSESPTPEVISADEQMIQNNIIKAIDMLDLPSSNNTNIIQLESGNKRVITDIGSQDPNNPIPAVVIPDITDIETEINRFDNINTAITELKEDPSSDITLTVSPVTPTEVDNTSTITITPAGKTTVDTPNSDEMTYNDVASALSKDT